jgi:DNA-binding NarL/FixJ family response regulator
MHAALVRMLGVQYGKKSISKLGQGKIEIQGITSREQEVLRWVRSGKTNVEIAAILYISTNTVKNHVHSAISKLGVENRLQAATKAYKLGLVNVS